MKFVYKLTHKRGIEGQADDVHSTKIIGFYSSEPKAMETISRYKNIRGFREYPDNFIIEKCQIDFDDFDFEEE